MAEWEPGVPLLDVFSIHSYGPIHLAASLDGKRFVRIGRRLPPDTRPEIRATGPDPRLADRLGD